MFDLAIKYWACGGIRFVHTMKRCIETIKCFFDASEHLYIFYLKNIDANSVSYYVKLGLYRLV